MKVVGGLGSEALRAMAPLVSVLMPVRDGDRWLPEAIDSIRAQTLTDYELIALDDGSSDETPRLLELAALKDERIRVIRLEQAGLVRALNSGIIASRGHFIARIDSDDRALPERLQRQVAYLTAHSDIGLLGTWAETIDERGEVNGRLQPPAASDVLASMLIRQNPFVHSSVMFSKTVLQRVGAYRPAFEAAEDYDLWLRIAESARVANLPEYLLQYRRHSSGVTGRSRLRQLFSVRLAQQAARTRRMGKDDSMSSCDKPPNWRDPELCRSTAYGKTASLFRFLDLATDPDATEAEKNGLDISVLSEAESGLSHAERRMAQIALLNLMGRGGRSPRRIALMWQCVRLHPPRAVKLGFAALKGDFHHY